nr:probable glutamate receptor [Cherax quadricarinatus]
MARPLREVLVNPKVVRGLQEHPGTYRFEGGASMVVSAVHWPPHVVVTEDASGRLSIEGPLANLLDTLAASLNFTYHIVKPADGSWGAKFKNGTWSGMVGQVLQQEVDIALGPFGITESRSKVVDFTRSFYFDDRSILARKGAPEVDPWGFMHPFTEMVWCALLLTLFLAWLSLVVLGRDHKGYGHITWASNLLFQQLRVLIQQDAPVKLFRGRERFLVGGWVVVAMMLVWSYQSTLVALLAVRYIPQPIRSIRDVVNNPSLTVIMEPNTIVTDTISTIKFGDLKELNDLKYIGRVDYQPASNFPQALDNLVRRHTHVIISTSLSSDLFIADLYAKTGKCDFYKARQTFFTSTHCIIGQKGSPIVPVISYRIRPLVESGLYVYWLFRNIHFLASCKASPSKITVREALSLSNLLVSLIYFHSKTFE